MNILMMTNTFTPHVGGVARSIERFSRRYRYLGHHVKVVAPEFDGIADQEPDVIRIPAVRHFNHTDFSVVLPIPHLLHKAVERFEPDIIHSHHPFLVGGTALRVAHTHGLPLVFTHHTRYEDYTHNVPGDSPFLKRFVKSLATNYANLCDQVFVPSESIQMIVRERGVKVPVNVVPTGVELDHFILGEGGKFRQRAGIPDSAFVVGHLGRLTEEKNLPFLVQSIVRFMSSAPAGAGVHCLIIGTGPLENLVKEKFHAAGLGAQLHMMGVVDERGLNDAYHAMNVFAFASTSETQGMVLTEAMASSVPVVALDAPGVREVVDTDRNGTLLTTADEAKFAAALQAFASMDAVEYDRLSRGAKHTAEHFSMEITANRALELYSRLRNYNAAHRHANYSIWSDVVNLATGEWELMKSTLRSAIDAVDQDGS